MSDQQTPCKNCPECPAKNLDVISDSWMWIKDTKGHGSVTVTLLTISFWIVALSYVLSIFERVGPLNIRPFDVGACGAFFAPILALYGFRRHTEAKFPAGE